MCTREVLQKMRDYVKYLRTFVEMVVVRSIATIKAKLEDQRNTCMFLICAQDHTDGTYCMLNLRTKRIKQICDVIWITKTYGEYISRK